MAFHHIPKETDDFNARKQKKFLRELLDNGGFVERAIRECKTSRRWLNTQLDTDETFAELFTAIKDQNNEKIEQEIYRRAVLGNPKPVIHLGKVSGHWVDKEGNICNPDNPEAILVPLTVREYSDNLLMFLAKANMPEKYRDQPQGKNATISDEELNERITRWFRKRKDEQPQPEMAAN